MIDLVIFCYRNILGADLPGADSGFLKEKVSVLTLYAWAIPA